MTRSTFSRSSSAAALFSALSLFLPYQVQSQAPLGGHATRFWDCCKPACSWGKGFPVNQPAKMCDASQNPVSDLQAQSGCTGGGAYSCTSYMPWAINDQLAYGFAAVATSGQTDMDWCCACYELTFTSGPASGQRMIVQGINTGTDLGSDQFDIMIPGGGAGLFEGCSRQYGAPVGGWGQQWGGMSTRDECASLPPSLQSGCQWRFDWYKGSDNPTVSYKALAACPKALTDISGCIRNGQTPTAGDSAGPGTGAQQPAAGGSVPPSSNPTSVAGGSQTPVAAAGSIPAANNMPTNQPVHLLAQTPCGNAKNRRELPFWAKVPTWPGVTVPTNPYLAGYENGGPGTQPTPPPANQPTPPPANGGARVGAIIPAGGNSGSSKPSSSASLFNNGGRIKPVNLLAETPTGSAAPTGTGGPDDECDA